MSTSAVLEHRASKREQIAQMFREHIGERISSYYLHGIYGSSFRTRVSDINLDKSAEITIKNELRWDGTKQREESFYFAELREPQGSLF